MWTDSWIRRKKTQHSPAGDQTWVFRLPIGRSNHWATKPRQELRANFCLSPNCQFFFTTRLPAYSSLQTRREQRRLAGFNYNCSNQKFVPVGTIPSNQTPSRPFFYPTNVSWQLDQTKKTQRSPASRKLKRATISHIFSKCRHLLGSEVSWCDHPPKLQRSQKKNSRRSEFTSELCRWISKLTTCRFSTKRSLRILHEVLEIVWSPR